MINEMHSKMDRQIKCAEYSAMMEHEKWREEIPFIKFPSDWEIKIAPPSVGAVIRFQVRKGNAWVSVYLDCYGHLGAVSHPYWEVYPYDGDCFRCYMNNTDELLKAIAKSIKEQFV